MNTCKRCPRARHRRGLCHGHYNLELKKQPKGFVPVGPVRERIECLSALGMSRDRIAVAAGVSKMSTVVGIFKPGREKMRAFTAARIMAVPVPERIPFDHPTGLVPAVGTQRRLRALVAAGYQMRDLATRMGIAWQTVSMAVNGNNPRVQVSTAQAVDRVFRELQMVPGSDVRAKRWAQRRGWFPPLAWDEDEIDNPSARPRTSRSLPDGWFDQYGHLRKRGFNDGQIAARMGISPGTLSRRLSGRAA